jgi:hypothetical protein
MDRAAMAKRIRAQKLIPLSAARAKIRSGYASVLEVCFSGFLAGVVLLLISAAVYFPAAMIRVQSSVSAVIMDEAGALVDFFSIRIFDGESLSSAILNVAVISAIFGAIGTMAGMILRQRVRREPSESFFKKRMRIPLNVLPFVVFFGYAGVWSERLLAVYLAAAPIAAFVWKFWYRIILSGVSSFDVDRLMPRPSPRGR